MLIAVDIGNTNIVIGVFEDDKIKHKWRLQSNRDKSSDDYAVDIIELFLNEKIDCLQINGVIIASVVPVITNRIKEAVKKFTSKEISENILVIGESDVNIGVKNLVKAKNEVGHDRLINAVEGYKKYGGNLIIVDFGTATTFDVIGKDGEYLGGVIAPGINLSLKALHDMTAQLPKISVKAQQKVIGQTTIEAMNSGVYYGYISLIEGVIDKIQKELGYKTINIFTGGLAEIFKKPLKHLVNHHEPDLTLKGLMTVYKSNAKQ